ncbi:MAG TPA: ABC transporter ATP-binding protein [Nocardioides sp.]|uniref:ABC transporter ATP-binding protein n=1 Tax=Nocardioides sp. TaxID=35761 RepID=UPI002E334BFA|nr:ABC transporter ATP-binding protein [Nocardioides sp.]HEX3930430.1 ABC transporter ATP-binding protein [Nocardioides sp.]
MAEHIVSGLRATISVRGRLEAELTAEPGETAAVIGPNGAGKSTLLAALAGLVACTASVTVSGRSWSDPPRPVRQRDVGLVFQDQRLFPHLSALDNVAFGPRARGVARGEAERRARAWLDRFGIADLEARRPGTLSGGQAQRVALSRALVLDPALLLLDEPFGGLDVGVATTLRIELARHLRAFAGVTVLVTHDAIDVLTLADRVVVLDAGRVVQTGTPLEVAARPRSEHVARLVGLNVLREGTRFVAFSPTVVTVSLREPDGSARRRWPGVIAHAAPHGESVRLLVNGEHDLLADVTLASTVELGLVPGRDVWLSVKESAVDTYAEGA